jgi:hypothetical protein
LPELPEQTLELILPQLQAVAPTVRGLREALDLIPRSYRPELFANEPCP